MLLFVAGGCDNHPISIGPPIGSIEFVGIVGSYTVIRTGESRQIVAIARDTAGNVVDDASISWKVMPPLPPGPAGEVLVSPTGLVTGVKAGGLRISACSGDVCATTNVYVRNPAASITFGVDSSHVLVGTVTRIVPKARDAGGIPIPVEWGKHSAGG